MAVEAVTIEALPWSTGTLRAFVTAIFLPLALVIVQRIISQLV